MKVYMRYWKEKCTSHRSGYYGKECGYVSDCADYSNECEGFEGKEPDGEIGTEDECRYCKINEQVIAKEIKSIEIDKQEYYPFGTVKIGRTTYDLRDVALLKVDYGEGFVTEWGDEEPTGEED